MIASSIGITFARLKNADCIIIFVLEPNPILAAMWEASIILKLILCSAMYFFILAGRCCSSSSSDHGQFNKNVPPSLSPANKSYWLTYAGFEHEIKSASSNRYVDLIGFLPNLKWDTVSPPDFLES